MNADAVARLDRRIDDLLTLVKEGDADRRAEVALQVCRLDDRITTNRDVLHAKIEALESALAKTKLDDKPRMVTEGRTEDAGSWGWLANQLRERQARIQKLEATMRLLADNAVSAEYRRIAHNTLDAK